MSIPRARLLLTGEIFDVVQDGIRKGAISPAIREALTLSNGTSAGQVDKVYGETQTGIAASTTYSYDLAGSLLDADCATITWATVSVLIVRNKRTDALANLTVGPHPTAGFGILGAGLGWWPAATGAGGGSVIQPGSFGVWYDKAGAPVVATTADILAVITSAVAGSTNSWDVIIAGRSV